MKTCPYLWIERWTYTTADVYASNALNFALLSELTHNFYLNYELSIRTFKCPDLGPPFFIFLKGIITSYCYTRSQLMVKFSSVVFTWSGVVHKFCNHIKMETLRKLLRNCFIISYFTSIGWSWELLYIFFFAERTRTKND